MKNHFAYLFLCAALSGCTTTGHFGQTPTPSNSVTQAPGCDRPGYKCIEVTRKDSWERLFPDPELRRMVKAINRTNLHVTRHKRIYVPTYTSSDAMYHYSPLPQKSERKDKHIVVDIRKLAYAAYDETGDLKRWGPIAAGKDCNRNPANCTTPRGKFKVFRMHGADCKSSKYPEPEGGAPMPYCMFFNGGIAMHGGTLPRAHASKGCVRMLVQDAHWLRTNFVDYGTTIIVK